MSDAIDVSELGRLADDLKRVAVRTPVVARNVVQKGALNIKTEARQFASGLAHAPLYPYSIGYDTEVKAWGVEAEIGPDKDKPQGALGNILEYGTSKNAPITHMAPALDREGPRFEKALADGAEDLL